MNNIHYLYQKYPFLQKTLPEFQKQSLYQYYAHICYNSEYYSLDMQEKDTIQKTIENEIKHEEYVI